MSLQLWLAFVATSTIVVLIPGPTVLMVIGDRLANGGGYPWSTVLGVGLGDTLAMTASLAGAGALLQASAAAFSVMKTIGGVYLLYLGVSSIVAARKRVPVIGNGDAVFAQGHGRRFSRAFLVTLLNPKAILFFVAFVPQFMSAQGSFLRQGMALLVTFVVLAMLNASLYASAAGFLRSRLRAPATQAKVGYAGGAAMITAGTLTLALRHR